MYFRYRFADGDHVSGYVDGLAGTNELGDPHCWSWNAGDIGVPWCCLGHALSTRKAQQTLIQRKDTNEGNKPQLLEDHRDFLPLVGGCFEPDWILAEPPRIWSLGAVFPRPDGPLLHDGRRRTRHCIDSASARCWLAVREDQCWHSQGRSRVDA